MIQSVQHVAVTVSRRSNMLTQSVPCDDVSSATVQAVRVASSVEVIGNDEPGVERGESVQKV